MKVGKSYSILPVQTKDEFLRATLIKFAQDENVDPKILESNFSVEQFEKKFYLFNGNVESSYTCAIGNNRTENYVEMEKKQKLIKQPDGSSKWEWVTEPVNKTRTVTDWSPFANTAKGTAKAVVTESGAWIEECNLVNSLISAREKKEEIDDNEILSSVISGGQDEVADEFASSIKRKLPGDTYKDFSNSSTVEITEVESYVVPYYAISYDYKGKKRSFEQCACSKDFSLVLDDDEQKKLEYIPLDTKEVAKEDKSVKKLTKIRNISWIAGIILSGVFMIVPVVGFFLGMGAIAVPVVFTIKRVKAYNSVKTELDIKEEKKKQNILNEKHKVVFEVLKKVFANRKLKEITFEEVYSEK